MSAQTLSLPEVAHPPQLAVSFRWLLGLYAIIPLCLILQLLDSSLWQGVLQKNLPSSPTHFLLFQILFGTPHIIASSVLFVTNRDYIKLYQRKMLTMTIALAIFFGVGSLFIPYRVFYVLVAAWTVYHVLKQQHGVARGVCRLPSWAFYSLLWLSVAAGLVIYIGIFLKNTLAIHEVMTLKLCAAILCVLLLICAMSVQRYTASNMGKYFLWANVGLIISSFYLYSQQYYFLAILIPRLVHDITAYMFYVTHDYNKHHTQPQNALYRMAARCHIHIFIVLPVLSFALAFVLQNYGDNAIRLLTDYLFGMAIPKAITVGLLGYLALMHYYSEAFTWQQGSPYRRFIAFSK